MARSVGSLPCSDASGVGGEADMPRQLDRRVLTQTVLFSVGEVTARNHGWSRALTLVVVSLDLLMDSINLQRPVCLLTRCIRRPACGHRVKSDSAGDNAQASRKHTARGWPRRQY